MSNQSASVGYRGKTYIHPEASVCPATLRRANGVKIRDYPNAAVWFEAFKNWLVVDSSIGCGASVRGSVQYSRVRRDCNIGEGAFVEFSTIEEFAVIGSNARVRTCHIHANVEVPPYATLRRVELVRSCDVIVIGPIGSRDAHLTAVRSANKPVHLGTGCFWGDADTFLKPFHNRYADPITTEKWAQYRRNYIGALRFIADWVRSEGGACMDGLHGIDNLSSATGGVLA